MKRLDKLDDIAKLLKDLADQNAALRKDLDGLRQNQQAMEARLNQPAPQAPAPPSASEVATAVKSQLDAEKTPKFQLLGANVGADGNGSVTFTGRGRFFDTLGTRFGFEAQGEYYYVRGQREGQADFGLVDRLGRHVQAGMFASFKHVTLAGNQTGGTLGEGALAVDYIFARGRVGIFGTKGFLDNALINRANGVDQNGVFQKNVILENYLKIVDQAGVAATVGLWGKNYAEGNLGYLKSVAYGDHIGGTVRLIFPLNSKIALTAEGGVNETMLSRGNDGRAVFGVQFGNMIRPKEYLAADHALPMEVPRVRYEVVTRRVRIGNDPPVANAGPNLSDVARGNRTAGWIGFLRSGRRSDHLPVDPGSRPAGDPGESHHLAAELYGRRRAKLHLPPGGQRRPGRAGASQRADFHRRGEPGADCVLSRRIRTRSSLARRSL